MMCIKNCSVMPDSDSSPTDSITRKTGRNLPSWMSSENDNKTGKSKTVNPGDAEKKSKADTKSSALEGKKNSSNSAASSLSTMSFPKLLEGVVFVLSGFVNPERGKLRSWALEMGAEYQPDWNSDCTLLVCAFPNTPKFWQVEADCGTIVAKEWVEECYNQKQLVDIDTYIMHGGKPWRKVDRPTTHGKDCKASSPRQPKKRIEALHARPAATVLPKTRRSSPEEYFPPSLLKNWALDDFKKTVKWLDSLEDKPEPSEMEKIGAEGVLVCLQDAIEKLEKNEDINQISDTWNFIPHVVDELAKLDKSKNRSKEDLLKQAMACKVVYEAELNHFIDASGTRNKKLKTDNMSCDSDNTIEMTEEEIERAYDSVASSYR